MTQERQLSQKAMENLKRNAELRKKDTKYEKLDSGESAVWFFDPEKIEPTKAEFNGKTSMRYQYAVTNPNTSEEKFFTASKRTSQLIDAYLLEGKNILKIQRIGAGKDTQYMVVPA